MTKHSNCRVEWPGKENQAAQPKGYVYIIFESEKQVRELLNACTIQDGNDANAGNYYYKISSKRIKAKEVGRNRQHIYFISVKIFVKIIRLIGRGYSVDNRRFKLRDSNIAEIGSNKNGVCWCFARKIDS